MLAFYVFTCIIWPINIKAKSYPARLEWILKLIKSRKINFHFSLKIIYAALYLLRFVLADVEALGCYRCASVDG